MNVLVVYFGNKSTFIQKDIDVLSRHYVVNEAQILKTKDILALAKKVKKADVVYIWFAGKHAGISVFFARLLRKKSVVMVGGYDAAKLPEIGYGLWAAGSFLDRALARYSLKKADKVLVVHRALIENLRKYAKITRDIDELLTGYDPNFWKPSERDSKKPILLTVGYINSVKRIKIKGIDRFLEVAQSVPEFKFRVIGVEKNMENEIKGMIGSSNVEILPPLPQEQLLPHYQEAKVYCQLSRSEGLPNSLCEAMLCECVPVVTNVGGMAETVNGCGVIVDGNRLESMVNGVKKAMDLSGAECRKTVVSNMSQELRERKLLKILKEVCEQ